MMAAMKGAMGRQGGREVGRQMENSHRISGCDKNSGGSGYVSRLLGWLSADGGNGGVQKKGLG